MQSSALTVAAYLAALPPDRLAIVSAVRSIVLANLDPGYEEGMQYGMIGYYVPHRLYPDGYHTDSRQPLPFAAIASQKQYVSIYLMGVYCGCGDDAVTGETPDSRWFRDAWLATGRKLDMGKSCVRVRKLDDVALDVLGRAIARIPAQAYIERYREMLARTGKARPRPRAR
jgi:hypothetical protein